MSPLADPRKFKPIEITGKDDSTGVGRTAAGVSFTFVLSQKPEFDWTKIFEEQSRSGFTDASFRIYDDKLTIHLENPELLQKAYSWIKGNVLPRTNRSPCQ